MATTVFHGLNIRWGTGTTACTIFGASSVIQTIDVEQKIDEQEIRNQYGNTVAWVGYNGLKEATFEYIASDGGATPNGNATVTQPTQGQIIQVTGGETLVNDYWIVKSVVEKAMNTDATKVSVRATRYPLITDVA